MPVNLTPEEFLDKFYLDLRSRILDLAAGLDRIGSSPSAPIDPRLGKLSAALNLLFDGKPDRAERVQMLFSDPYDAGWRASR